MVITKDQIFEQLKAVKDPELHRDIVTLDRVLHVAYCDGLATIRLDPEAAQPAQRDRLRSEIDAAVRQLGDEIQQVSVEFAAAAPAGPQQQAPARPDNPLPDVKHIIAVGAGKGGVGKSTVAVNLAVSLARQGLSVGLLDGDIYGPSTPTMLGLHDLPPRAQGQTLIPFNVHGIKTVTIGRLVEPDRPLIWRGPMAHGAFRQLATQTQWGELDYLIIDLPPGTGDVPLTMSQLLPLTGAVVVCTPQRVAQDDARRAVRMFQQLGIHVLGVVENMSYFIGDDGKEYDIFGRGGAEHMASDMAVPFLGTVPINMRLRANCDAGDPTANFTGDDKLAEELNIVARKLDGHVNVLTAAGDLDQPSVSVH
ncbi:MAG: Mrp/NBP35 family ATP-binding protein [Phycisphaeraceae bacterium]